MPRQSKAAAHSNTKHIQRIRRLWLKTEAANGTMRGSLAGELESYFRASVFLMGARLRAMNTASKRIDPSVRKTMSGHIREFKKELRVSSEIGYFLLRSCRIK